MGIQSSSSPYSQLTPQHSLSHSHISPIHFPHQPSNPLLPPHSSYNQFEFNSDSLSILSKQQMVESNYQQQFDPFFTNFRPQSKLIYGKVRILCSKITNEKVQEYRVVFRNQQQMKVYLMSYYWRKAIGLNDAQFPLVRTVNFKISQDSKNMLRGGLNGFFARSCSSRKQILCRVYTQDIPLRLCHIKDIPFPENLYVLKQSLRGFQIIYQNIGYIRPLEDLICIGRKGQVKVWINSDLSKNFPNVENMESNFTQINSQSKLINEIIQLVNTNTDSQGEPCPITMYMKQWHVNIQHITFDKIFQILAKYCMQFGIQIPQLFASIVEALNEEQQQYDTYRTEKEPQHQRESSMLRNNSGNGSFNNGGNEKKKGNTKSNMRRQSNNNSQQGNLPNMNNSMRSSKRNIKKRPTHIKSKTQSLHDNPRQQRSQQSSSIHNQRAKSNILLSYSMPISSNINNIIGDSVVEDDKHKKINVDEQVSNKNSQSKSKTKQPQKNINTQLLHNFLSNNQLSNPPNETSEYSRNKKTYSNFWQRSQQPGTTLMSQQPSSSITSHQNPNYIITSKQQYEQMLRIDKYIQAQMLQEEYQQDKLRSIKSSQYSQSARNFQSQYKNSNDYYCYGHQRVYSNNYDVSNIRQQHAQQQQQKINITATYGQQSVHDEQIANHPPPQVQTHIYTQMQREINKYSGEINKYSGEINKYSGEISKYSGEISKYSEKNKNISSSQNMSQSLSVLPDLQEQSNRKVIVKESVSVNNQTSRKYLSGEDGNVLMDKKTLIEDQHVEQHSLTQYHNAQQFPSPFKGSSGDSFLPSSLSHNQPLTSDNNLSPQKMIFNLNNLLSNNIITSHQSQLIISNTSIGHSLQGGVYQNNIIKHNHCHPMNHSASQYASANSYQVFNGNHCQAFQLQNFKSAEFSSYDATFGNYNKVSSPIIPKITFTIHSPKVYSTSSQHYTTSLQQSLVQTNTFQYSQQQYQPQYQINLEPNLTVSNANCKPTQQPNFKRLAHRANTVKSNYMNSQGNQISSRKYYQFGQNQSLQSKPSIVQYSLLRNPEMFKFNKQQQNILIHETLQETNSFQKLIIDKPSIQPNRMNQLQKEQSEKIMFEREEMQQQQQLSEEKQNIQQKQSNFSPHSYLHNQSEPQLRHQYYQKGSQMVPIPEDVMAETINNSHSLLMINNFEQSINLKTIRGQKNSSNDSNNSHILKSINHPHLSDFGNDVLLHSYEYQPEQQLAYSYHKKLLELDDKSPDNNKVNFNLNANIYTNENIIMEHQISKIQQRKSHQINLNGMHISKPSFQSILSSQIPFKQGFSSKQFSSHDRSQSSSNNSQRKPHYLKLIATKSISGSRAEAIKHNEDEIDEQILNDLKNL